MTELPELSLTVQTTENCDAVSRRFAAGCWGDEFTEELTGTAVAILTWPEEVLLPSSGKGLLRAADDWPAA